MFSAERLRDWVLLLLCNLMWASQFVLVKIVQEQMGPVAATSFPMLIATILLFPIVRWESRSLGKQAPVPGKDWLRFLLIGVLGLGSSALVRWMMQRLMPWHRPRRGAQ